MGLKDELISEVKAIFKNDWSETAGRVVPYPTDIGLGNKAVSRFILVVANGI